MLVVLRVKEFPPFLWGIFIYKRACLHLNMSFKVFLASLILLSTSFGQAQNLGGSTVYNFLKLPMGARIAAMGGKQVTDLSLDISLAFENPALLNKKHHAMVSATFNNIATSVTALQGIGAFHDEKTNTNFSLGVSHLLYGEEIQTDASGNILGSFRAFDQQIAASFSRSYGNRWRYGATLKFINSNYGVYRSAGIAADVGLTYTIEDKKLQFGFTAKNMGGQLRTYGGESEDLPFDLVLGVSKQLDKAPLRFSIAAQRIHQFDILYKDTLFNNSNFGTIQSKGLFSKVFSHFILGTELLIGDRLFVLIGYNVLRRYDLGIQNITNGLTGFNYGLQLNLNRVKINYARSHYQSSLAQNQLTIGVQLIPDQK